MKKTIFIKLIIVVVIIGVFGCGNDPLNKKYNKDTYVQDLKDFNDSKAITADEAMLMAGYIIGSPLTGEKIEGKTYRQILIDAKAFKANLAHKDLDQGIEAEKLRVAEKEKSLRLGKSLSVILLKKDLSEYDYQKYLTFKFNIENKTDKDIRGFKGTVEFQNIFGDHIKTISITYDQIIKANSKVEWTGQTNYNQYDDSDVQLSNKSIGNLKIDWKPEKIIFVDGSTLE